MSRWLILGGTGFIGRNLVTHLVEELEDDLDLIRVVDIQTPDCAFLTEDQQDAFDNKIVEFMQLTLTDPAQIDEAFEAEEAFDYVVHLAATTRFGLPDVVYTEKLTNIALNCARAAVENGVEKFIYLSDARVYKPKSKPLNEKAKISPQHVIASAHYAAEEGLRAMNGLPLIILRPAIVYGIGDLKGLMPRVACAAIYQHLGDDMKFLHTAGLLLNTVHVTDVCRAIVHMANFGEVGSIFNLADETNSTQGSINEHLSRIFSITTDYFGKAISAAAMLALKEAAAVSNSQHLRVWNEICKEKGVDHTPINPFLDLELLKGDPLCINGKKIEDTGFYYSAPQLTAGKIMEMLNAWQELGLFPN
ncbi:hypothetical protein PCE1_002709 [Barthelona sp. PCE]